MTTQTLRLKLTRVNSLQLKVLPKFPAVIATANFLTLTKANGTYSFGVDYSVLTPGPILDPTTAYIAISDTTAGIYRTVTLASLLTSGLDADLQAIAALAGTGVLVRTAANTWALRTLAGTANEITVTNGDGVSGAPTLSLPAALTFTGKTVTGGTFNSPALVTPALGTPASGVATNLTGTASGLTAGHVTTNANLTGPVTSVGNATSVTANAITNAMCAQMAAYTLKGNATGSTANEADIDVTALTSKPSPVSADIVLIQDSAASNAFKKTTVGALASAGSVASFNALTGAVTTSVVVQKFTASGTYTPTAGMLHAIIECVGGGGGGGGVTGAASQYYSGGGGGSGGYSRSYTTATAVGASKAVTIGAAGAGGAGSNNGTAGGATSVGTLCVANGGSGGLFCSGAQVGFGGDGATAGTGDIIAAGMPGASGMYSSSQTIKSPGSNGGSSIFGGGGKGSTANGAATNGSAAGNYGSGGGGAAADATASTATGGAGSAGFVIITEYVNL